MGERFHTSDMALVAFLSIRQFAHCAIEKPGRNVVWYFSDGEALQRELESYRLRKALVEPKEFMQHVARIREEMYASFDLGRKPRA